MNGTAVALPVFGVVVSKQPPPKLDVSMENTMGDQPLEHGLAHIVTMLERNQREAVPALWSEFDARMRAHLGAEEEYLLPALLRWRRRDAQVIVEEHKLIRRRLDELATAIGDRAVKVNDLRRFLDELCAHERIEDQRIYPWADEHFQTSAKDAVADVARTLALPPWRRP